MDPNEALKRMRELAREAMAAESGGEPADLGRMSELAEQFQALDSWLTNGGFLPDGWSHRERTAHPMLPKKKA